MNWRIATVGLWAFCLVIACVTGNLLSSIACFGALFANVELLLSEREP